MLYPISEKLDLNQLYTLRHKLHQFPELSGQEEKTANTIEEFLSPAGPSKIIRNIGGHGIAFIYDSGKPGPYIGFRCELDALPIQEIQKKTYCSGNKGISHKCGHDGHMTILAGLGLWLQKTPLPAGKVLLLYQPAEETGQGAPSVMEDPKWNEIKPEWLFGLHNIPGYPEGTVVCKDGPFCAASKGLLLKLKGTTSHAAEPEKGNNPNHALAHIMLGLQALPNLNGAYKQPVLLTPVYAHLGEKAFGTSAGAAEFGATLRSFEEADINRLTSMAEDIIREKAAEQGLEYEISYEEVFPATVNFPPAAGFIRISAKEAGLNIVETTVPFRWSEDFGWYSRDCKTAFAGLGAGEKQPALHHPDYDFPDQIILPGLELFTGIIKEFLFKPSAS